jgi:hypothetical protein
MTGKGSKSTLMSQDGLSREVRASVRRSGCDRHPRGRWCGWPGLVADAARSWAWDRPSRCQLRARLPGDEQLLRSAFAPAVAKFNSELGLSEDLRVRVVGTTTAAQVGAEGRIYNPQARTIYIPWTYVEQARVDLVAARQSGNLTAPLDQVLSGVMTFVLYRPTVRVRATGSGCSSAPGGCRSRNLTSTKAYEREQSIQCQSCQRRVNMDRS